MKLDRGPVSEAGESGAELLDRYESLLASRALELGLIAPGDRRSLRVRHIDDSLRAMGCLGEAPGSLADVGSGAGLPGIPIAIALPHLPVVLIEPRRRAAAFLELAVERLRLENVDVRAERAEVVRMAVDVVTARAVAAFRHVWRLTSHLLAPDGRVIYFAGASWRHPRIDASRKDGLAFDICARGVFPWQGPLVIMRSTSPASSQGGPHLGS